MSLGAAPISGLLLGAESSSAETGDIYTLPLPEKKRKKSTPGTHRKGSVVRDTEVVALKDADS